MIVITIVFYSQKTVTVTISAGNNLIKHVSIEYTRMFAMLVKSLTVSTSCDVDLRRLRDFTVSLRKRVMEVSCENQ